ncbi:MAG: hypothetical protein NWE99_04435 [Candidatus Bathyarchaeota archaeon]|nr:hypothetical protein [Candidatus Bathyarchaeota archaeon]
MKRKAIPLTLALSLLLSASAGTLLIQSGAKTFIVHGENSNSNTIVNGKPNANVTIQSPENRTYNETNVTLGFAIESDVPPMENFSWKVTYQFFMHGVVLDYDSSNLINLILWYGSAPIGALPDNVSTSLSSLGNNLYMGNATLAGLSQGTHNVTVWVSVYQFMISYDIYAGAVLSTVSFYIDSIPPNITILSPEAKTYDTSGVPLDFTVSEAVSQFSYCLDGKENVMVAGNTTLTGLSDGAHNVTVYATDLAGNVGASETVVFTIAQPFPVVAVAVGSGVVVAVVAAGLLFRYKKRKPEP